MNKFLTILKSWYGVLILVLLAGGVLWFVNGGMPKIYSYINNLRENWEVRKLQAQWEKPYREDTYGGKTPEETYDMFLDALRKGDTTLASKYFVVDEQEVWLKTLEQYKTQNFLKGFIDELEDTEKIWKKLPTPSSSLFENTVSYGYTTLIEKDTTADYEGQKINVPAGSYENSTTFELNTYTKVWKISSL